MKSLFRCSALTGEITTPVGRTGDDPGERAVDLFGELVNADLSRVRLLVG